MERTEDVIRAEYQTATQAYHDLMQGDAPSKLEGARLSAQVKALRTELSKLLAMGAHPCADCQSPLVGHLRRLTPEQVTPADAAKGVPEVRIPEVRAYEIVCLDCLHRSQGPTPRAAVLLWNAGEFVK